MTHYNVYVFGISLTSEGAGPIPLQANYSAEIMADSAVLPHPDGSGGTVDVTALPFPAGTYILSFGDTANDITSGIRDLVITAASAGFYGPGGTPAEYVSPISLSKQDVIFI